MYSSVIHSFNNILPFFNQKVLETGSSQLRILCPLPTYFSHKPEHLVLPDLKFLCVEVTMEGTKLLFPILSWMSIYFQLFCIPTMNGPVRSIMLSIILRTCPCKACNTLRSLSGISFPMENVFHHSLTKFHSKLC